MNVHRPLKAALGLAMLWLAGGSAHAAEAGFAVFKAPVLDGVEPAKADRPAAARLVPYRFEGGRDWPAIRLFAREPLDWSMAGSLTFEVDNPASTAFHLLLRLDDDLKADGGDRSVTGVVEIAPHTHRTVVLRLDAAPMGMRGRPPGSAPLRPGDLAVDEVRGAVDLHHIVALHVSGMRTAADHVLWLGPPVLRDPPPGAGAHEAIADPFGQSVRGSWPEKITSVAGLRARLGTAQADTRRLAGTSFATADRYGGVDGLTHRRATGYFRIEKVGGRWSFITPEGHRFFSLGIDGVASSNPTIVAGRAGLFQGLPAPGQSLARYLGPDSQGRQTFDVGRANLERGLGPGWEPVWRREVIRRLKAWGFNTLGNWSEAALTDSRNIPYVSFYDVEGESATVPMGAGRSLPDPFDPRFPAVADAVARSMTASRRNDPYLLGYFSGNELPWGTADRPEQGIAAHVLALGPDSFAKKQMIEHLRARYATVAAFRSAWGLLAGDQNWAEMLNDPVAWPASLTEAARLDVAAFQARFAELYFRTVAQAIHRHDPNHLYLGTRFAAFTPEVVRACARWCDVLSFNVYGRSPEQTAAAWRGLGRPVLIGEFHFGSTDRGSFWPGMVDVGREENRGPAYGAYLAAAVRDPEIVGCHWYQYADEPLTGRPYDGENGHVGLVAVTDVPYGGFAEAVGGANRRALATFAGQAKPDLRGTE